MDVPGTVATAPNVELERGGGRGTKRTIENGPLMEADGSDFNGSPIPGVAVLLLTSGQSIPQGFSNDFGKPR